MIVLLVLACAPDVPLGPTSPAVWVDDTSQVTVGLIGGQADTGPAVVWVRARNGVGASVLGGERSVEVDGVATEVSVGPQGYALLEVDGVGTHTVEVPGATAQAWVYRGSFRGFGLTPGFWAPMQTTLDAVAAGRGVLTRADGALWWTGTEGRSHVVLDVEDPLGGVVAGHLDGDGVLDAAAWAGRSVHLLRGRAEGGMVYAGQLRSATHDVAAVAIGDASGDGLTDLVVTWVGGPSAGRLDVWEGDGLLGFTAAPNRVLDQRPFGVTVGDNQDDGAPDVTVSRLDGNFWRFYREDAIYAPMGPALVLTLDPESNLLGPRDLNGDGADELLFVAPWEPGVSRAIRLFDLNEDVAQIASLDAPSAWVALTDLDADGREELLVHGSGGNLTFITSNGEGGLATEGLLATDGNAPLAVPPGSRRVLSARDPAWLWHTLAEGPEGWAVVEPELLSPGQTVPGGVFAMAELDADPTRAELIALRPATSTTRLWVTSVGPDGVSGRGEVELADTPRAILDLAVCGTDAWVLLDGSVHRVGIGDPDALVLRASADVDGRRIACGDGPAGPVAVLQETQIALFDDDLQQVAVSPAAGSAGVRLGPLGATTCERVGCTVVTGPVGPGGAEAEVEGWPEGATLDGIALQAAGTPTLADVDGNGFMDVVFHDAGRIVVLRHTGDSLGPPTVLHTRQPLAGRLGIADFDGDGSLDAWGVEPESERLRVTPAGDAFAPEEPAPPTSDTGDTGTPAR